jgi:predicted lysophospholipase L1 biosynthesis ABC-type transport system permease subunit
MSTQTASSLSPGPLALAALIFLAALSRLIPHPPNFSPVEAVALFGGAYFANRAWALVVPLIGMFVSDLALGLLNGGIYFDYFVSAGFALIYLCLALSAVLGFGMRGRVGIGRVIAYSLMGSVLFFLVTNFGTWLGSNMYQHTAAGLLAAYVAGIPFFQNTALGTLFYSGLLFGAFAYLRRQHPALRTQTA